MIPLDCSKYVHKLTIYEAIGEGCRVYRCDNCGKLFGIIEVNAGTRAPFAIASNGERSF